MGVGSVFSQVQEQQSDGTEETVHVVVVPDIKENATVTAIVAQILREAIIRKSRESVARKDFVNAPDEEYINELVPSYQVHSLEEVGDVMGLQKLYFLETMIQHKLLIIPSLRKDDSPQQEGDEYEGNRYIMLIQLYGGYDISLRTYTIKVDENTIKTIDVASSENVTKDTERSIKEEISQNARDAEKRRIFVEELENIAYQINDIGSRIRYAVLNINPQQKNSNPLFTFESSQPMHVVISRDRKRVLFLNEVENVSIYQIIEGKNVYMGGFSIKNLDKEYTVYASFHPETVLHSEIDETHTGTTGPLVRESPIAVEFIPGYQVALYSSVSEVINNSFMLTVRGNYDFDKAYVSLLSTFSRNDFTSTQSFNSTTTVFAVSSGYHTNFFSDWVWSAGLGVGGTLLSHSNISNAINTTNSTFIPVGFAETRMEFNGRIKATSFYKVFFGVDFLSLFHMVEEVSYSVDQITGEATVEHAPVLNTELLLRLHIGGGIRF